MWWIVVLGVCLALPFSADAGRSRGQSKTRVVVLYPSRSATQCEARLKVRRFLPDEVVSYSGKVCVTVDIEQVEHIRARCTADWLGWYSAWAPIDIKTLPDETECP